MAGKGRFLTLASMSPTRELFVPVVWCSAAEGSKEKLLKTRRGAVFTLAKKDSSF